MRVPALSAARRSTLAAVVAASLGTSIAGLASPARATEFEVQGDTALQGYEVVSPWGDVTLQRRRFTQTLGLSVYNLQGTYHPGEADYRVVLMMRLDSDFGINANLGPGQDGGETNYHTNAGNGVRFVPGLQQNQLDVMYGYVEGRNLAHGMLGFRVGRQYVTDVLGWWAFDGGLVRVTTPYYVQAEVYGGLEERGGLPLSTSRFESQGVWRGSHAGFGTGANEPSVVDYPSYIYTEPAPAFGAALDTTGLTWLHAHLAYRRVYNTGTALTTQFPGPEGEGFRDLSGTRVSQDRVGFAADAEKRDLGAVKGGFAYDLYNQLVSRYYASIEAYAGKKVTLGADADYFVPTFDADSIWNWFTHGPLTTLTGRLSARPTKRFNLTASGGTRLWQVEGDPTPTAGGLSTYGAHECAAVAAGYMVSLNCSLGQVNYDASNKFVNGTNGFHDTPANRPTVTTLDAVGNLDARYRWGFGDVSLRSMVEAGSRGSREGGDLAGEARWDGGRFTTGARASLYGWHDPIRPDRDAVSFGYVLAGGFKPASIARFRIEWEHDTNRLVGQRYRVIALVNLLVLK
jgi:hypothetical protein